MQTLWRLRVAYWISKQAHASTCAPPPPHTHTHTHTDAALTHAFERTRTQKYVILIACHGSRGFVKAPQYYVTRTLPFCSAFPLV